ncbi:MAG: SMP-30/gluconolactonase/LRE family protein [Acidobacteriota bacterium]|nr:SMP-30/gluconolactonase/LRE family protein [Acidobacteriota bacterium]
MVVHRTASAQIVTTVAGSGARGSVDGAGVSASFSGPSGLAVDSGGNLYVADEGNNKIRKVTAFGAVTTLAGSGNLGSTDGKGAAASFRYPSNVAVDASGNVYVTEESFWSFGGGSDADIRRITPDGEVTTVGPRRPYVMSQAGVAVDASGNLYVADSGDPVDIGRGQILKITPDGLVTTVAADGTLHPVSNPRGVAVDWLGHLYVTDSGTGYLTKFMPDGSSTILASGLNYPAGLTVDSSGNVYVAELGRHRILKVATDGEVTTVAGSGIAGDADGTGTAASFNSPTGIALGPAGNLYVSDSGNEKIRKITFPVTAAHCVSDFKTLCLSGNRFQVTTRWATSDGRNGLGHAVALPGGETGYFTFFDPGNVEVAVKVLNGCSATGSFWILAGGLTDVGIIMTVTDTYAGTVLSYTSPPGKPFPPIQDTTTFASCAAGETAGAGPYSGSAGSLLPPKVTESFDANAAGSCVPNATTLCLSDSRYQVRARWITSDGASGAGQVIPLTGDTGGFWFFSPSNLELVVKVLNGCGVNSRYWTFAGGLTDVNVILTVTDTQTGTVQTYTNPQGQPFEPIQDTKSFATCL